MNTYTTVVGNLTKSPDVSKVGQSGVTKAVLRVASNENRRDPRTGDWVEGPAFFVNVICWRVLGENVSKLQKGDPVIVYGRLRTREWTTASGDTRWVTEIDATSVGPDLTKCIVSEVRRLRSEAPPVQVAAVQSGDDQRLPTAV